MHPLRHARSRWPATRLIVGRWAGPIMPFRSGAALRAYPSFVRAWRRYARMEGAETIRLRDGYPCLLDSVPTTPYRPHYFHQAVWAIERIIEAQPDEHVDVGSEVAYVGMLSAVVPVTFVDIRPLPFQLPRLRSVHGDLLELPFADASLTSISCLHVAEHVGLGRYGDEMTPAGTRLACRELARVLAVGGSLLFSVPVGRPRVYFNAHRVHAPEQILQYFDQLELAEFSVVNDRHELIRDADLTDAATLRYGCGLFRFHRSS